MLQDISDVLWWAVSGYIYPFANLCQLFKTISYLQNYTIGEAQVRCESFIDELRADEACRENKLRDKRIIFDPH